MQKEGIRIWVEEEGPDRRSVGAMRAIVLDSGNGRTPDVLVAAAGHFYPALDGAAVRAGQIVRHLDRLGLGVDLLLLADPASMGRERDHAEAALRHCRRVAVVRRPEASLPAAVRLLARIRARMAGPRLGDRLDCPPALARAARRVFGSARHRGAIVCGTPLAPLAGFLCRRGPVALDAGCCQHERWRGFAALGRGAEFIRLSDARREARLANGCDAVTVLAPQDAASLRSIGVSRPIAVVPFAFEDRRPIDPDPGLAGDGREGPAIPPRLLFVGSGTPENLDGIRFFRTRVFPTIHRSVPTCRLRIVGLAAHHLDPGPGLELVGPTDRLRREYRAAAAALSPSRIAGGIRCKAVEALAYGKALIATVPGARGIDLEPGRDAVVSDDPAVLAREAVRILQDGAARASYESRAREIAAGLFDAGGALGPLVELLGLDPDGRRSSPSLAPACRRG